MKTAYKANWFGWLGILLAAALSWTAGAKDVRFDMLHFRTGVLTNATVFTISKTDIGVSHSKGLINIKLVDLDAETLRALGLTPGSDTADSYNIMAAAKSTPDANGSYINGATAATENLGNSLRSFNRNLESFPRHLVLITLGLFVAFYLFISYCLKLIVQKTGTEPGFFVWVPVLQLFPMLQGAGMSGWWFVAYFIPGLNIVAQVMWSIKIVERREKSGWVTVFLILPVTSFFAFLYLAFSSAPKDDQNESKKLTITPPPLSEAA